MHATYAPEQACQAARTRLELQGISVKDFAIKNDLHPSTVYAVLNGQKKCLRGEAHRAAVLLGIKDGVVTN
ncbi:DNA-binding protein [Pseudomonas sp. P116]|uniref:DNA-binding protein n=1 Tax=Pseudomonas sp. P116 TaxID=2710581 RepID=UPI001CC96FEC|nr:DNA-binding protein [Pseudomonas sp. P116]MBZ9561045.1 DNA-binding protein [Pseudomonas sp. P116]